MGPIVDTMQQFDSVAVAKDGTAHVSPAAFGSTFARHTPPVRPTDASSHPAVHCVGHIDRATPASQAEIAGNLLSIAYLFVRRVAPASYHLYDSSKCTSGLQRGPVWQHRLQRRAHGEFSVCSKWHQPRVRASGGIQPALGRSLAEQAYQAAPDGRELSFQPDILDTIGIKRTSAITETECRGSISVFPDELKCPTCITQDLSAAL